jgi:hypothetical protein
VQSEDPKTSVYREMVRAFLTYAPIAETTRISPIACVTDEENALYLEVEHRLALQRSVSAALRSAA